MADRRANGNGHGGNRGSRNGGVRATTNNGQVVPIKEMASAGLAERDRCTPSELPETLHSFGDVLRLTKRPDNGGTRGQPVALEANHFRFEIKQQIVVQQYEVDLYRIDSTGKKRTTNRDEAHVLFWVFVEKNADIFGNPEHIVYDRKKQMYGLKKIPQAVNQTLKLREKSVLAKDKGKDATAFIEMKHVAAIDMNNIKQAYSENLQDRERNHIQFLDLLFRQGRHFNDQLVSAGRSFYFRSHDNDRLDLGCGRELLRGFFLSTRIIDNWQLSLNVNWNATAFYEKDNLVEFAAKFLMAQYRKEYNPHDTKPPTLSPNDRYLLEGELKGIQLKANHINQTFKMTGIATATARNQKFHWQERDTDHGVVTVEEYFKQRYNMLLKYPEWPMIQRGKGNNARFMPIEVCEITPGQRVKNKDLTENQHSIMIKHTAVTPYQRRQNILNMLKEAKFANDPRLRQLYISMSMAMAEVTGRVLPAPMLQYTGSTVQPSAGQWNGATLYKGASLKNWGFINFSRVYDDDIKNFAQLLYQEGRHMGMDIAPPYTDELWRVRPRQGEEKDQARDVLQVVKKAFDDAGCPLELLVIILDGKAKDGPYNEIKRYSEQVLGVMTQCLQKDRVEQVGPRSRDGGRKGKQALSNIILKINAKLGGVNVQIAKTDPIALKYLFTPILFVGADVTHPEPGDRRSPSIAAVCGNIDNHPNKYIGIELIQPNRMEVIGDLKGAIKKLLKEYFIQTGGLKPDKIVFYRDGVSEGQFLEVLTKEERAIEAACTELEATYKPAITFIVVQKRHHTRFFKKNINPADRANVQNILPGTVVDRTVTHPEEFDFFLCSHQGIQGTSKPTHYHVLFDQTGFKSDELQALTYQLCHTYARCTRSVSIPAPCYYAHHIAFRAKLRLKGHLYGSSSGSSSSGSDGDRLTEEELRNLQDVISLTDGMKMKMYWQ